MKEYRSRNSGRYVFNEDMHNLQDLALSPAELFRDCSLNFVISGCVITVTQNNGVYTISVTEGYVWLNGKIRKVAAFSGTTNSISIIGIYAVISVGPLITYFNGDSDNQYNDYSGAVQVNYDNTGSDDFIAAVYSSGNYAFPNLRTAYFNHYCIMNNGTPGHVSSLLADEIDTAALKINHVPIADIYVPKSGCTMNSGASLTFVNGNDSTTISGSTLTVGGTISGENLVLSNRALIEGEVTANRFIKDGGTSSQFLKADGSIDSTVYATNARADTINGRFDNYLLLTGGTLTGDLTVNSDCLISGTLTVQAGFIGVNADLTGYVKAQKLEAIGELKAATGGITGALTAGSATINGAISAGSAQITSTVTIGTTLTVSGSATAEKFIKSGGTSNQFLKANGDVDTNSYALVSSLNNYLLLTGGTLSGNLTVNNANVTALKFIVINGQSNQFLKADGTIDSNTYLTTASATSTYLTKTDAASTYLPLNGGVVTGALTINATLTTLSTVFLGGNTTVDGIVTASQFKVPDRTGFLKANGSIDDTTYLQMPENGSSNGFIKGDGSVDNTEYLPLTGGTITQTLTVTSTFRTLSTVNLGGNTSVNGIVTASQFKVTDRTGFLKANGDIDDNTYITTSQANANYATKSELNNLDADAMSSIGALTGRIGLVENSLTSLSNSLSNCATKSELNNLDADAMSSIGALTGRIGLVESNISTLSTNVNSNIGRLDAYLTALTSRVSALENA